jgi:hypothetical protein
MKILLIGDAGVSHEKIHALIKAHGFVCETVHDPEEARRKLREASQHPREYAGIIIHDLCLNHPKGPRATIQVALQLLRLVHALDLDRKIKVTCSYSTIHLTEDTKREIGLTGASSQPADDLPRVIRSIPHPTYS